MNSPSRLVVSRKVCFLIRYHDFRTTIRIELVFTNASPGPPPAWTLVKRIASQQRTQNFVNRVSLDESVGIDDNVPYLLIVPLIPVGPVQKFVNAQQERYAGI